MIAGEVPVWFFKGLLAKYRCIYVNAGKTRHELAYAVDVVVVGMGDEEGGRGETGFFKIVENGRGISNIKNDGFMAVINHIGV